MRTPTRDDLLHPLEKLFSSLRTILFFVFFFFLILYLVYFLNGGYSPQGKGLPDTEFCPGCRVLSTATSRPVGTGHGASIVASSIKRSHPPDQIRL